MSLSGWRFVATPPVIDGNPRGNGGLPGWLLNEPGNAHFPDDFTLVELSANPAGA